MLDPRNIVAKIKGNIVVNDFVNNRTSASEDSVIFSKLIIYD